MQNKEAIAALQEELRGLDQEYPVGTPRRNHYHAEQSALHGLKDRCFKRIQPYWNRIAPAEWKALQIRLKFCENAAQVIALYDLYRGKLHHSKVTTLPELDQTMPKSEVRTLYTETKAA